MILALHADLYAINMMYADWRRGLHNERVCYDYFFRRLPFGNGFAVFAGLERFLQYLTSLRFEREEIEWLRARGERYDEAFLEELASLRFTGDVYSVREGEVVFPGEPLMRVEARAFEGYLIEAALLNFVNYQTLVATKAARIVQTVRGVSPSDKLLEFGTRRAHEESAAIWAARAAYIAGFDGTSNMKAAMVFGIPASGTMAHSFVQRRPSELEAFREFAEAFPDHCILLVDTYDALRSGIPNAITVARELAAKGRRLKGIRIDSGDLAYLSKQARKMLDEAGFTDVSIVASGDLDENIIADLKLQRAKIDAWGIGTRLVTAFDEPALGGVYKLAAQLRGEAWVGVIKVSENEAKVTTPGRKQVYRLYGRKRGEALGDLICLEGEAVDESRPIELVHPVYTYKRKLVEDFEAVPLLEPVMVGGERVAGAPSASAVREFHARQIARFDEAIRRRLNPHVYPVTLSPALLRLKEGMLQAARAVGR